MSRERVRAYRSSEIETLGRQLRYAPAVKRAEAVFFAEVFHDQIEPEKNYPIDYVVYRLTGKRVPPSESVMLAGEALRPDVRLFIDALSQTVEIQATVEDPCETTAELAKRLDVSTKTVARWRDRGLRWRWGVKQTGARLSVLFPHSAVQAFCSEQPDRIDAAKRFGRFRGDEKGRLIKRVRRLAHATDFPPQQIYRHLAKRTGRSVEALRLLIAEHDREHPDEAVFGDRAGPLSDKHKRVIARAYARGITVSAMCDRFRKTRSTIYRAVNEQRARQALAHRIEVIESPLFDRDDADEVLMQPTKRPGKPRHLDADAIESLPGSIRPIYSARIDPDSATRSLIVRYNYIKHTSRQLQKQLARPPARAGDLDRFEQLVGRAQSVFGDVLAGTLPIVLSVVRRQLVDVEEGSENTLLALLDRANAVLVHEIERFDASLSHQFESVLTNRLLQELARTDEPARIVTTVQLRRRLKNAGLKLPD